MLTLGTAAHSRQWHSRVRKDFSGLSFSPPPFCPPSSTATASLCLPPLPCPPPQAAIPHPCAIPGPVLLLVLSGGFLSLPLPHHHPHIWLLSFLHLNPGIFLLHVVSPQWISLRTQKRQTPGSPFRCLALSRAVEVCSWNGRGSPAWPEVETCSGRMKTSGVQLLNRKEYLSYPLSMCKFSFPKAYNVAKFGQIFRRAKGISLTKGNPLTSSCSKEEGCQSFSKKRSQLLFNLDKTMNFSLPSLLETAEFVDVFQKLQPEADTWHGKFHSKWL